MTALERAIEIGREIAAINTAIDEGQSGYSNRHFTEPGYSKDDYYETPLFRELSDRREDLRSELIDLPFEEESE